MAKILKIVKNECSDGTIHQLPESFKEQENFFGICAWKYLREAATRKFSQTPRHFEYYSISHLVEGGGWYWTPNSEPKEVVPGQGIIVSPYFMHNYGGREQDYVEDSICFFGPAADYLFHNKIIRNGIIEIGKTRRLLSIIEILKEPEATSQLRADIALLNLLLELYQYNRNRRKNEKYPRIQELLKEIKHDPFKWWVVSEMAEYCNLSDQQFRRLFHACTGLSPKKYIDKIKINLACEKLLSTDDSIGEIAASLGYVNQYHFSKRFKQITGTSPRQYQKSMTP